MGAHPTLLGARLKGSTRGGLRRFLAVFLAAEVAVLAFVLAEHAWPRGVPDAFGWIILFGSYPWSLPWIAESPEAPATAMAVVAAAFALNVAIAASAARRAWAWFQDRARRAAP